MADRKKVVVGVVLTVSLALNFFFLGWLVGRSPLFPGPSADSFGRAPRFAPFAGEPVEYPEKHIIRLMTRGMSQESQSKLLEAIAAQIPKIEVLAQEKAGIRKELKAMILESEPDGLYLAKRLRDYDDLLQQRIEIISDVVSSVLPGLDIEDQRTFVRNWQMGPGGRSFPPPPPPPPPFSRE